MLFFFPAVGQTIFTCWRTSEW